MDLLRELFHIPEGFTPLIFGHTGSYNWEMTVVNTPSDCRALGMDLGAFSSKWANVFQQHGREIDILKCDWGQGISPEDWREALKKNYGIVLLTHNETSTGVMLPVESLAASAQEQNPETLIAVDGVSIAGAVNTRINKLRPDYYLWSLQKDFSIPAIGSIMIVSDRAIKLAETVPNRGYVLDLVEWASRAQGSQTPMTVPDLTLHCLAARLEEMKAEGDRRFERHQNLTRLHRTWAEKHGLSLLAEPGFESPTVSAIHLPKGVSGPDFVAAARTLLNVQLAPGYGSTKDGAFRIAAMGHTSEEAQEKILQGLSLILENWKEVQQALKS